MTMAQYVYRMRLRSFVDFAFRELHPGEYLNRNWHIDLMVEILLFFYRDNLAETNRLIFNLPAGYLKTHVCSVSFPTWVLGRDPRKSVLILSEYPESAFEIQERCATLMSSSRYQAVFPRARIKKLSRAIELEYGGGIRHAGMGFTSQHKKSDIVIIDNPQSLHSLDRIKPEHFSDIGRLLKDPKKGMILMVTRRLGENDLSAFFHEKVGGWSKLAIPVVALEDKIWEMPPDVRYRQRKGEPLHPCHEGWEDIEGHHSTLKGEAFAYQYLQGLYFPPETGHTEYREKDGTTWLEIGAPCAIRSMSRFLQGLRAEFDTNLSV